MSRPMCDHFLRTTLANWMSGRTITSSNWRTELCLNNDTLDAGGYHTADAAAEDAYKLSIIVIINCDGHRGDGLSVRLVRDVE